MNMSKLMCKVWRYIFESGDKKRIAKQHPDISDLEIIKDIAYIDDGDQGHLFDIYRRIDGKKSDPVMINIHDGGLFASYKEVNAHSNYAIAKMGYTVVSLSYRRIPETTLWHQVDDILAAFRYIDEHAKSLGINTDDLYISGDSAGALLTLFGVSLNDSAKLQEAFSIKGSSLKFKAASLVSIMLETQRKDIMSAISNVVCDEKDKGKPYERYLLDPSKLLDDTDMVPIIQFTSAEDLIQKDSLKLCGLLEEKGIEHEMYNYEKGKEYKLVHVFAMQYPDYKESKEVFSLMDRFFQKHKGA